MKDSRIKHLFAAARKAPAPEAPSDFAQSVQLAIRRDKIAIAESSVFDQLAQLFPRLAWSAALMIVLCVATNYFISHNESANTAAMEQIAEEWLYAAN